MSTKSRWSSSDLRETIGIFAVVASLIFVGWQIRQSNIQAKAAAFQALGIATSEYHITRSVRVNRLYSEAEFIEALKSWTFEDWESYHRNMVGGLRLMETAFLQFDAGLFSAEDVENLGFQIDGNHDALASPGFRCVWPMLNNNIGTLLRTELDEFLRKSQYECPVDLDSLKVATILETRQD